MGERVSARRREGGLRLSAWAQARPTAHARMHVRALQARRARARTHTHSTAPPPRAQLSATLLTSPARPDAGAFAVRPASMRRAGLPDDDWRHALRRTHRILRVCRAGLTRKGRPGASGGPKARSVAMPWQVAHAVGSVTAGMVRRQRPRR